MKEKTIKATIYDPKKYHIYSVKTTGKHPIHMIEGGDYITEDKTVFNVVSDMGYFWLNKKEYDLFKSNLKDVTIKY